MAPELALKKRSELAGEPGAVRKTQAAEAALYARAKRSETLANHQAFLLDSLCEVLAEESLQVALDSLADSLKQRLNCSRVAIAIQKSKTLELISISQQAAVDTSSTEASLLLDAMREAVHEDAVTHWPRREKQQENLCSHRALASRTSECTLCTVPLFAHHELTGVLLLERDQLNDFPTVALERLAVVIAPLIALHIQASAGTLTVLNKKATHFLSRYLGSDRPGMRVIAVLAIVGGILSFTVPVQWSIVATAELLPHQRQHVTSPENGFIKETYAALGDQVEKGQLMAELDHREFELEVVSLDSEIAVSEAEFRAAMASYDRQAVGIARARLAQQRAKRERLAARLERTRIYAPVAGNIISANSARTSGAAVSRGETLFELAPDKSYSVKVLVNESDIHHVYEGQTGKLALHSNPESPHLIVVESLHPVAETGDGASRFRVKANLEEPVSLLRAGQHGIVRIDAGNTNLFGKLTRRLNQRLRQLWWRYVG